MIGKKYVISMVLVVALIGGTMGILQAETGKAPDVININNTYAGPKKYEASKFTHKKHSEGYVNAQGEKAKCVDCHHDYKDGKNIWKEGDKVEKCIKCHPGNKNLSQADAKKLSKEEMVKEVAWAFHENCIPCHKAVKEAKKGEPPAACAKCHPKVEKK